MAKEDAGTQSKVALKKPLAVKLLAVSFWMKQLAKAAATLRIDANSSTANY
jgi:hypothetical protein